MFKAFTKLWIWIELELRGVCSKHFVSNSDFTPCQSCREEKYARKRQTRRAKQARKSARIDTLITQLNKLK